MRLLWTFALCGRAVLAAESFVVPGWNLQVTTKAGDDLKKLSASGFDSSSWYSIGARKTVFAGLLEAGVYNTDQLFFSKNLQNTVDYLPFYSPWLYRAEFALKPGSNSHFFLQTNGITSKADIYMNGNEVADKSIQAGAYGGQTYDITKMAKSNNALVIKAYPTDYNKDFGLGFVDWNPYPPDNGTGVWRDVSVKQTGPLYMSPVRITNNYNPGPNAIQVSVQVKIQADVSNLESSSVSGTMNGVITDPSTSSPMKKSQSFKLGPGETRTITLTANIQEPKIWWPKQWGSQPLYSAQVSVSSHGAVSDKSEAVNFGIRRITSHLNEHNDTMFKINGHPFQVRGAGYTPDMFLRWDQKKFEAQAQYVLDMGMNTIRLEGKEEQPELYDVADQLGLMVMPGWECCDKWEAWSYNDEVTATLWDDNDYRTANVSMRHEAAMLQTHPSILAFLVGSDFWPDHKAAAIYVEALHDAGWQNPIICSAAKRGYPEILGPSGLKMPGPYDWVPPNYWYGDRLGAAFGFGSELGAGVGTPEMGSLKKFLSKSDLNDLWNKPHKGLYHMSTNVSSFFTRHIYDRGMFNRFGEPTSLEDYLLKAQMMDYEATRAEYEGYAVKWNYGRPATGLIYWMLNNAWPSLHWNQFDYYLHPGGSYFGTKVGARLEHVAYHYNQQEVYLINHSLDKSGARTVEIELMGLDGKSMAKKTVSVDTEPITSKSIAAVPGMDTLDGVAFLRLILKDGGDVLSRNVYWVSDKLDELNWDKSSWYSTPVSSFANLKALNNLDTASVSASVAKAGSGSSLKVTLQNKASVPAFFIRLNLVDGDGEDVVPVFWSDNYVTLWPHETLELEVEYPEGSGAASVEISGSNVGSKTLSAS